MREALIVVFGLVVPTMVAGQTMTPARSAQIDRQWLRQEIEHYQWLIAEQMKHPSSVIFRDVWVQARQEGEVHVCGEINAKGAGGGYVGFSNFMARIIGTFPRFWVALHLESDGPNETVRMTCRIQAPR